MINHSTKSPPRRHKDVSPAAKRLLCFATADDLQRVRATPFSSAGSENCLEMPSWQRAQDKVCHTCEKLKYGHVSLMMTTTLAHTAFSRNNGHPVSDACHKSNRLPVCLPAEVGERSETAVSVPASCSLPLCLSAAPANLAAPTFFNSAAALSSS